MSDKKQTFKSLCEELKIDKESVAKLEDFTKNETETLIAGVKETYEATIEELKAENAKLQTKNMEIERKTPGTFTAKNKKDYRFVDGVLKFNHKGEIIETIEALTKKELMEELISAEAGIIEEVK